MKKLLIADDELYMRTLLEQTLEEIETHDIEILIAEDGEEAVNMALTEHPQVILLDIMMPKLDGFQVCRRIKEDYRKQGLEEPTILILTARGQDIDFEQGQAVGADCYMTKPFKPDTLYDKVYSCFSS